MDKLYIIISDILLNIFGNTWNRCICLGQKENKTNWHFRRLCLPDTHMYIT